MAVLETDLGGAVVVGTLGVTDFPFTFATWARRTGTQAGSVNSGIMSFDTNSTASLNQLICTHTNNEATAQSRYNNGTVHPATRSGVGFNTNTWYPVIVVFAAENSRTVYFRDGSASNSGSVTTFAATRFRIGQQLIPTAGRFLGQIVHAAVWDKALDADERTAFLDGGNPLAIANANLRAYYSDTGLDGTAWTDATGRGYDLTLEVDAVIDTTTTGPTVDAPPSAVELGITITGIKEPNIANEEVTGVSNARVKLWPGTDDTEAETVLWTNIAITGGEISTTVTEFDIDTALTVEVMWTVGTERKLFITETTVVDLEAGS